MSESNISGAGAAQTPAHELEAQAARDRHVLWFAKEAYKQFCEAQEIADQDSRRFWCIDRFSNLIEQCESIWNRRTEEAK